MLWNRLVLSFIAVAIFAVCPAANAKYVRNSKRPNIILIMADDVGYECFGCYGSKQYKTPNIDRLAKLGMRFDHCYSQPLCTPSRVMLMTGLSNARNYSAFSILNRGLRTVGQYFKSAGYATMIGGKWQLYGAEHYAPRFRHKGTLPKDAGFDHSCLWQVDRLGKRYWNPLLCIDGKNKQFGKNQYGPDIVTKHITDFMAKNRDRPFFVYYPMILVHSPFLPTPDSANRKSKNKQKNFEGMVAYMDKLVGRIVNQAEKLGIAENTLIIFTGDNGTHRTIRSVLNGVTIRGGKGLTTDAGTHVPMVAYWPGVIPKGRTNTDLISLTDFLPTMLETVGAKIPGGLDGRSFLPQLQGKKGNPRDWLFCYYCPRPERTKPVRFVRSKRWKLYGDGRFYDVHADRNEKQPVTNLKSSPGTEAARRRLTIALRSMPAKGLSLLNFKTVEK